MWNSALKELLLFIGQNNQCDRVLVVVPQIACCWVEGRGEPTVTFDTAFCKLLNAIGDICERTCCHKVLFYMANKFL